MTDLRKVVIVAPKLTNDGIALPGPGKPPQLEPILAEQIGDDGLAHLEDLAQLEELTIAGSQVTDAGLQYVEAMKNLKTLRLFMLPETLPRMASND